MDTYRKQWTVKKQGKGKDGQIYKVGEKYWVGINDSTEDTFYEIYNCSKEDFEDMAYEHNFYEWINEDDFFDNFKEEK